MRYQFVWMDKHQNTSFETFHVQIQWDMERVRAATMGEAIFLDDIDEMSTTPQVGKTKKTGGDSRADVVQSYQNIILKINSALKSSGQVGIRSIWKCFSSIKSFITFSSWKC